MDNASQIANPQFASEGSDLSGASMSLRDATVEAYVRSGVSRASAERAYEGAEKRDAMLEDITRDPDFGGVRYEPEVDEVHIWSLSEEADRRFSAQAAESEVRVVLHRAGYSLAQLREDAKRLSVSLLERDAAFNGGVTADPTLNRIVVLTTEEWNESRARSHRELDRPDAAFRARNPHSNEVEDLCTSRLSCGNPARAGVAIGIDSDGAGPGVAGTNCSAGGTAIVTAGGAASRWMTTAGHCSYSVVSSCPSSTGCIGHGQQYYGPVRQKWNKAAPYINVDVARARLDNPYWSVGGYIYSQASPNNPNGLTYNTEYSYVGGSACLSAKSGDDCAIIEDLVDGNFNLVRVGTDSCGGDSGGLWFRNYSSGNNRALGLQSTSTTGCNIANGNSWYSGFDAIYDYWDDKNGGATLRLETQ